MKRWHSLPAEVYALVEQTPATVLLEGGKPDHAKMDARMDEEPWTRLFTAPLRVCAIDEVAQIPALFAVIESSVAAGLSAAGFFSYECGNCFEPKAGVPNDRSSSLGWKATMRAGRSGQPLAWFGIYERGYVFDHETGEFVDGAPPELSRLQGGKERVEATVEPTPRSQPELQPELKIDAEFALTGAEYARRIAAIHEWIRAGDVYQLNFTAPWRVSLPAQRPGSVAALYARLRSRQPAPYGAFLHCESGRRILSFSPELFFRVEGEAATRRIATRPMKGTAPRGRTAREDREIAEWLRNDPKNRSENVMIVDLLRNDLGRLARFGTVRVEKLFAVERYPTLWQMTSTVSAELCPEVGFDDIFRALFPCGSVTGAPKIRAMQLIAELEDAPRGIYTGAIGFFSPRQTVFNVAIRTLELTDGQGTMGAGSGIVIDSVAAEEYRECLLKAEFLTGSSRPFPERFSLIETMLWDGGFPLIELHLDRLEDSADYFDFPCERAAVKAALEAHARRFARQQPCPPRRVRLLLDGEGGLQITDAILTASGGGDRIARARIEPQRTDPADPMLYHKTTHRPLYLEAFQQAVRDGCDDVLFLNLRGEVTEGAISNIFIEKDGRWFTPPVECGLLGGVYRRHMLETRPEIEERVLVEDDLRCADAVYLCNAVRGLRRVEINWGNDGMS